jgi:hypothetical protein
MIHITFDLITAELYGQLMIRRTPGASLMFNYKLMPFAYTVIIPISDINIVATVDINSGR